MMMVMTMLMMIMVPRVTDIGRVHCAFVLDALFVRETYSVCVCVCVCSDRF